MFRPFHFKKWRRMRAQIKRKLAQITTAKLHILYSKSKEAMKVKRSLFNCSNGVHSRISGAKLGSLIRSRNGQISFPIFVVEILICTCLFWFNYWFYLLISFCAIKELCLLPNWEEDSAITMIQTCKKAVMYGAKVKYATLELVSYFDLYFRLVLNYLKSLCSCYE